MRKVCTRGRTRALLLTTSAKEPFGKCTTACSFQAPPYHFLQFLDNCKRKPHAVHSQSEKCREKPSFLPCCFSVVTPISCSCIISCCTRMIGWNQRVMTFFWSVHWHHPVLLFSTLSVRLSGGTLAYLLRIPIPDNIFAFLGLSRGLSFSL